MRILNLKSMADGVSKVQLKRLEMLDNFRENLGEGVTLFWCFV